MWALFAVYQAICQYAGAAWMLRAPRGTDQLPACPRRRGQHGHRFPPDRLDLALAAFLLKILMSAFFVRDRPGRASPRKSKKASDFPARKPAINPRRPWRASGKRPDPSSCPGTPALGGRAPERRIKTLLCRWATLW